MLLPDQAPARDEAARQVLAEAGGAWRAAQADLAATLAAVETAEAAVLDARALHDAADAAVAAAPHEAADHLQAVARGSAGPAPVSARERREALHDAVDALLAARSARDLLRQRVPADEQRVTLAEGRCKDAAVAVMRAECGAAVAELLAELERAQETTARLGAVAEALMMTNVVEATAPVKQAVGRHASPPSAWGWQNGRTGPDAEWRAALAVLMTDADAPAVVGLRA